MQVLWGCVGGVSHGGATVLVAGGTLAARCHPVCAVAGHRATSSTVCHRYSSPCHPVAKRGLAVAPPTLSRPRAGPPVSCSTVWSVQSLYSQCTVSCSTVWSVQSAVAQYGVYSHSHSAATSGGVEPCSQLGTVYTLLHCTSGLHCTT